MQAVTMPAQNVSAVQIDAAKRAILCEILVSGKVRVKSRSRTALISEHEIPQIHFRCCAEGRRTTGRGLLRTRRSIPKR